MQRPREWDQVWTYWGSEGGVGERKTAVLTSAGRKTETVARWTGRAVTGAKETGWGKKQNYFGSLKSYSKYTTKMKMK